MKDATEYLKALPGFSEEQSLGVVEVESAEEASSARRIVLGKLALRAHSSAEIRSVLKAKDIPTDIADNTIRHFLKSGLLDDAAFAKEWVRVRWQTKGIAPGGLRQELKAKGVDEGDIERALVEITRDDEYDRARELALKRVSSSSSVIDMRVLRRTAGFLARRGYSSQTIAQVCRDIQNSHYESDELSLSS